jgi:hypothetical protein
MHLRARVQTNDAGALYARACAKKLHIATINARYTLITIACNTRASSKLVQGSCARCCRLACRNLSLYFQRKCLATDMIYIHNRACRSEASTARRTPCVSRSSDEIAPTRRRGAIVLCLLVCLCVDTASWELHSLVQPSNSKCCPCSQQMPCITQISSRLRGQVDLCMSSTSRDSSTHPCLCNGHTHSAVAIVALVHPGRCL